MGVDRAEHRGGSGEVGVSSFKWVGIGVCTSTAVARTILRRAIATAYDRLLFLLGEDQRLVLHNRITGDNIVAFGRACRGLLAGLFTRHLRKKAT